MKFSEDELNKMEEVFKEFQLDPQTEEGLTSRALQSEKDIENKRVYTPEEADARIKKRLGL